jgi:CO/xanthine dehydrogenase FAD-binding subunit
LHFDYYSDLSHNWRAGKHMKLWNKFLRPNSIDEALHDLADSPAPVCVIAGGSDLMLELRQGSHTPVHTLVDVTSIPEMGALEVRDKVLFIGAAVPLNRLAESPLILAHAQALQEACCLIAGPQVRNVATLGGNVAHALPAADGTIAMMCLDVQAEVADMTGQRLVPFAELFLGPGTSALKGNSELLVGFHVPLSSPVQASAFRRIMRAQGIALPILNLSAWVERRKGVITRARIACGPSGPIPRRQFATEKLLSGKHLDDELIERALASLLSEVSFRTSPHRATADYRIIQAGVLLKEALSSAWDRAGVAEGGEE